MQNYEDWKNWSELNFAEASTEENLYFSKLRKKFKLSNDLDVLEIGYGNGSFLDFSRDIGWNVSGVEAIPELRNRASQDNSPAGKGHYVIDALHRGASRVTESGIAVLPTDKEEGNLTAIATYAGRVFYSGISSFLELFKMQFTYLEV